MPITEFLEQNAKLFKDDVALVEINPEIQDKNHVTWREYSLIEQGANSDGRNEITWEEFDKKANRFANLLLSRGIKKGDRVAILLMNCIEYLPIYFGILKTGALVVPLNYRYTADEIRYCLKLSESDAIVFGPEFVGRMEQISDRIPKVKLRFYTGADCPTFAESYNKLVTYCTSKKPEISVSDNEYAAIYFSSGTTGFPKAILHAHKALVHSCRVEQAHHSQSKDDVFLCIPPLYHTGAKMHWFGSLLVGGKTVLLKGAKPEGIIKAVSQEKCTIVWLLVPWAQDILDAIDRGEIELDKYTLSQWRLMHIGAQPVPPSLIKRWLKVFPHHQYDTNYGLSESIGPGCVHLGVENTHKVGAIGVPGYNWQVKIIDENGNEVSQGEAGELCVKGPGVMTCYYHDEEATNASLKDGWLLTGDVAMMDEDGFIYLVDRKKDVIIMGGENIYPVQIESFIMKHPAVKSVGVIGSFHARLGEIPIAIIELKDGMSCTEEEMDEFCQGLPRFKRPKKYIFAPVPHNPTGKIEKPKLREMYGGVRLVAMQNEIKQ